MNIYNTHQCKECQKTFNIYQKETIFVVCPHCYYYCSVGSLAPQRKKNFKTKSRKSIRPLIPLHSKVNIENINYEITGFMFWKEKGEDFQWHEFLLYDKDKQKYAFLTESNGHWNYVKIISSKEHMQINQEHQFRLFHKYEKDIVYAEGEFNWDISEIVKCEEATSPPLLSIHESGHDGYHYFLAKYIPLPDMVKLFPKTELPRLKGIGSNQPFNQSYNITGLTILTLLFIGLLFIVQMLWGNKEKIVFSEEYQIQHFDYDSSVKEYIPVITPEFRVTGKEITNLEYELFAPLANDWLDTDVTVSNTETGEEYELSNNIEYYSGYEGSEHWSEGSQSNTQFISDISPGTYKMHIWVTVKDMNKLFYPVVFKITMRQSVLLWSNFFICSAIILIFPAIQLVRFYDFEEKRWEGSNYTR